MRLAMLPLALAAFVVAPAALPRSEQAPPCRDRPAASARDIRPAWSPDGSQIAFVRVLSAGRTATSELRLTTPSGGCSRLLVRSGNPFGIETVSWSPDGRSLVVGRGAVSVIQAAGGPVRELSTGIHPVWSPRGDRIAFLGIGAGLRTIAPDGAAVRQLTPTAREDVPPAWSPDGSAVVVVIGAPNRDEGELVAVGADGSSQRVLARTRGLYVAPAWSPDGTRVAFVSEHEGPRSVYVVGADGSGERRVTATPPSVADARLAWSPDGTAIAFTAGTLLAPEVRVADLGGGDRRVRARALDPDWSGAGIAFGDVTACGARIAVAGNPRWLTNDCRMWGTPRADRLVGTPRTDLIYALAGNDRVNGDFGADTIYGGRGDDSIDGGGGREVLYGEQGDDELRAHHGYDLLDGGPGRDMLNPGPGRDTVRAGAGDDLVHVPDRMDDEVDCGPGRDRVRADRGDRLVRCEVVVRPGRW